MQTVTTTRPLTVTRATGRDFTLPAGVQIQVTFAGWTPTAGGSMYELSGETFLQAAREAGVRIYPQPAPGLTPLVRVDYLHQATMHPEPLYKFCRRCQFTGRLNGDRSGFFLRPRPCPACDGTRHAKTYPANSA